MTCGRREPRPEGLLFTAAVLLVVGLLAGACIAEEPAPATAGPTPSATVLAVGAVPSLSPTAPSPPSPTVVVWQLPTLVAGTSLPEAPPRDLRDLARRLVLKSEEPVPEVVRSEPLPRAVGDVEVFEATNLTTFQPVRLEATLRYVSDHAYFYVDNEAQVDDAQLEKAARLYEEKVRPNVERYFGTEWTPGVDADPHLTILLAADLGTGAYYSAADEFPKVVNPLSNEREMIYVDLSGVALDSEMFGGIIAHELQHAVHWAADAGEDGWVDEGLAELAGSLAGYPSAFVSAFVRAPDTQLNDWANPAAFEEPSPHYGASYLFMRYLLQRYGDPESGLRALLTEPLDGIPGVEAYLAARGGPNFERFFLDWVLANYLDQVPGSPYAYDELEVSLHPRALRVIRWAGIQRGTVHQFAADYWRIVGPASELRVTFQGAPTVLLLDTSPQSGSHIWWSTRADGIDSRLTRRVDLRRVSQATLRFSSWYDIEKDWDYAYVEASRDGVGWETLQATTSVDSDPHGNNFGWAFTGRSGGGGKAVWVEQEVDLTPYAGDLVWLRFEYVTDEATSEPGLALDDIRIPEIGFVDDAESNTGWQAEGFLRVENTLPQRFAVLLLERGNDGRVLRLRPVTLDAENRAEFEIHGLGEGLEEAVVIVAGLTRDTTEVARYTLEIQELK